MRTPSSPTPSPRTPDASGTSQGVTVGLLLVTAPTLPAAVLWDMDGTLVDTEPFWMRAEYRLAAEYGGEWTEGDGLHIVGSGLLDAAEYLKTRVPTPLTAPEVVDYLKAEVVAALELDIPWQPGALDLIEAYRALGVPQALVTMSYADVAAPVAAVARFDAIVTGDLDLPPKPHPDPYLRAAEMLGVDAADCLAVEDSPTGATSANAAGCFVIGVPHAVDVPPAERRVVLPTLADQTPQTLAALVN